MEKTFALGVSGLFGLFAWCLNGTAVLFAQVEADSVTKILTDCGIAALLAVVFYKINAKIIDIFGKTLVDLAKSHDEKTTGMLDGIGKEVGSIRKKIDAWNEVEVEE